MAEHVNPIGPPPIGPAPRTPTSTPTPPGPSFKDILEQSIGEVNRLQAEAQQATEDLMAGRTQDIGRVLIATQKADTAFKMLMEIRNKLVAAYDELRQMRL